MENQSAGTFISPESAEPGWFQRQASTRSAGAVELNACSGRIITFNLDWQPTCSNWFVNGVFAKSRRERRDLIPPLSLELQRSRRETCERSAKTRTRPADQIWGLGSECFSKYRWLRRGGIFKSWAERFLWKARRINSDSGRQLKLRWEEDVVTRLRSTWNWATIQS